MFTGSPVHCIYALGIILLCSSITVALDMNNICLLLKNDALIASGDSCTQYYFCSNGIAIAQNCSSGTYFNKNTQMCVSEAPAYCTSTSSDPCSGSAVGSFVAKPDSCESYYYCSDTGAEVGSCPNGLYFDSVNQICDYPSEVSCPTTNDNTDEPINLCSYIQVGVFFGNAFNCSGWLRCTSDTNLQNGTCRNSLLYNTARAMCDYATNVDCSQVTNDPELDVTGIGGGGACSTEGTKIKATACNQYYLCDGTKYQLTNCVNDLYYDTETETCVERIDAYNDCDRCLGTTDMFVNAFGTDCHEYLYCSNGVKRDSEPCPNNGYFNEELGGCVSVNPEFKCCANATQTGTTETTETQ
nr:peritrophin-48 [Bactrocera oleae]